MQPLATTIAANEFKFSAFISSYIYMKNYYTGYALGNCGWLDPEKHHIAPDLLAMQLRAPQEVGSRDRAMWPMMNDESIWQALDIDLSAVFGSGLKCNIEQRLSPSALLCTRWTKSASGMGTNERHGTSRPVGSKQGKRSWDKKWGIWKDCGNQLRV